MSEHDPPTKPRDRIAYVASETRWPTNLMLVTSAFELGHSLLGAVLLPFYYGLRNPIEELLGSLLFLCFAGLNSLVLLGALRFKQFRNRRFVIVSVILLAVPVPSPFCIVLNLPIAIWSLVVLYDPYVRTRFEAVARGSLSENSRAGDDPRIDRTL